MQNADELGATTTTTTATITTSTSTPTTTSTTSITSATSPSYRPAEHWSTYWHLLVEAARSCIFLRPRWHRIAPSPMKFALLFLLSTAITIALHRLLIVGPAAFYWRAQLSGWLLTLTEAWVCYLLARPANKVHQPIASGPQLFCAALAQALLINTLIGASYGVIARGWPSTISVWPERAQWAVEIGSACWIITAELILLLRATQSGWRGRVIAGTVLSLTYCLSLYAQPSLFWYAKEAPSSTAKVAKDGFVLSQESIEAQQRLFDTQLAAIQPQRHGIVDLYAITFGPYAADVFKNESGVVGDVMRHRFDADGRTLQLLNHAGTAAQYPWATPLNLQRAIVHFASMMDRNEDILFLHLTSHGARDGELAANFEPLDIATVTPQALKKWLDQSGIRNRVISISACYSGSWIKPLADENTLVMTAADADHTSYGCGKHSELTYFGRAMFDEQLRHQTTSFEEAHRAARLIIKKREEAAGKDDGYSNPQIRIGEAIRPKLVALERRLKMSSP